MTTTNEEEKENGCVFIERRVKREYAQGNLIRPLVGSEFVTALAASKMHNDTNTVQLVWLKSPEPIDPQHVKTALHLMAKHNSVLQLCVVRRRGTLWFKRMSQFKIDFETTNEKFMDVYDHLLRKKYDMKNGPLWRARFIPSTTPEDGSMYTGILVYGVQHCITDGPTCMIYIRETVRLLNLLTRGATDIKSVPSGLSPTLEEIDSKSAPLVTLKALFKESKQTLLSDFSNETSFNKMLPRPVTKSPSTKLFLDDLSEYQTKAMLAKCKSQKVTIHSFITSCCSIALMKLVEQSAKQSVGERTIKVCHCIDGRRYFAEPDKTSSACHLLVQYFEANYSLSGDFWSATRTMQEGLKRTIVEEEKPIKIMPLSKIYTSSYFLNKFLTWKSSHHRTTCHFMTTNMGNLKTYLPEKEESDPIDITYIIRSVKNEFSGVPFMIGFQTFRNRFLLNMDCYTSKMSEKTGRQYFDILCSFIRIMIDG